MLRLFALTLLLLTVIAPSQGAILQTYNDSAVFSTAFVQSGSTIDFETFTGGFSWDFSTPAGLTLNGVKFVQTGDVQTPSAYSLWVSRSASPSPFYWGTGATLVLPEAVGAYTTVTLPSAMTAVGFNAMTAYNFGGTFTLTLEDGSSTTCSTLAYPTAAFCGLTSTVAFSTIKITTIGGKGIIDNVQFGNANEDQPVSDIPEVATMLMIATGLAIIRYSKRIAGTMA